MSFEEELLGSILVEEKEKELAIEEKSLLKKIQVEKKHLGIKVENVLVGNDNFNFPIYFMT